MWGVSLTHPMLPSFFMWEICVTHHVLVSFFILIWGVSLTHPMLAFLFCGEFPLHIPCWLHFYVGSFSYTSHADFVFMWGFSLTLSRFALIFIWEVCVTHPVLVSFFIFIWGVSLTHPMLASFLSWEFLWNTPCWFHIYLGSFSYMSHAGFPFLWGVSLTHPVAGIFKWRVSLTHPMLILFLCGEFLSHIPCSPHIYLGGLCYTSRARSFFIFIWGVSLTHPMLASFLSGEFLLRIPCWLSFSVFCPHFYLGSFSYTSRARFTFIWGVSLTHPMLA